MGSEMCIRDSVYALQALPTNIVMTYAYVNPIIAVYLGWLVLDEEVTAWTLFGASLIILGVIGVFRDQGGRTNKR